MHLNPLKYIIGTSAKSPCLPCESDHQNQHYNWPDAALQLFVYICAHQHIHAEWEDVPRLQEARPASPEIFDMDTEHDNAPSSTPSAPIRLPPGLNIQASVPTVPVYQPFNMFAQQQEVSSSLPPGSCTCYTIPLLLRTCCNTLGPPVRLRHVAAIAMVALLLYSCVGHSGVFPVYLCIRVCSGKMV